MTARGKGGSQGGGVPDPRVVKLPHPPSTNKLHYTVRRGFRRPRTREYDNWLKLAVPMMRRTLGKIDPPVTVTITVVGGFRGRDLDNYGKCPIDALVMAEVLPNDNRNNITGVHIVDERGPREGHVLIEVSNE